jgi:predicted LPLAT superfamily acyltransferase
LSASWKQLHERGGPGALALFVWIALHLGRRATRLLLPPIVLYFFLTSTTARRASRRFLHRAGAPLYCTLGVLRHMHAFACCAVDRVFLLSGRYRGIHVSVHDPDGLLPHFDKTGGALVATAHIGSSDLLRVVGANLKGLHFRIVMDRGHGNMVMSLLERLNPALAEEIIDAESAGGTLSLALHDALRQGYVVGLMADRVTPHDPGEPVSFLGAPTQLPNSPWRLAGALGAPVVLCFGLYRGGARYELHFERFLDGGAAVPRPQRAAFVSACARRYAQRLEHYARDAPYNWFNFYPYWTE